MIIEVESTYSKGDYVMPTDGYFLHDKCIVVDIDWNTFDRNFDYLVEDENAQRLWYKETKLARIDLPCK